MAGSVQIQSVGPLPTPSGDEHINLTISLSGTIYTVTTGLSNGANTITPPTGTTLAIIIPPAANAVTITLKGVTGDTGVPLSKTQPSLITLASAAAFVLTAGAAIAGLQVVFL